MKNHKQPTNLKEPKINNKESDFVKTPKFLKQNKALLNPLSTDKKSFQHSITLSLSHKKKGKNFARPSIIEPYIDNFRWGNINFPPTEEDYKQFEIGNDTISLNILKIDDEKEIDYIYKSQFRFSIDYEVNLLLLEKKHYTCVENLTPLFC